MSTQVIVEHKDRRGEITFCHTIRGDNAEERARRMVCCCVCKGTGQLSHSVGGNLWALGWEVYQRFYCAACGGFAVVELPTSDVSSEDGAPQ